jgi:phosphatidylglycerophosphatase A
MNFADSISTVFGIGRIGVAPGTVASVVTLPFAWVVLKYLGPVALFSLSFAIAALGFWASDVYVRERETDDPSECVIDEVAGQCLACALAPLSLAGFALAFALFRLFDISKLWPISEAERLKGGLGIMADDMVAGLFAGLIVAVITTLGLV